MGPHGLFSRRAVRGQPCLIVSAFAQPNWRKQSLPNRRSAPASNFGWVRLVAPTRRRYAFRVRCRATWLGGIHMSTAVAVESKAWNLNRWNQLILGVIAMMAISSPQYVWTLFTGPLNQKLGTTLAELQWTVSLLIILQTWFSPFQAYLVDRFGPRLLISVGALLSGG